MSFPRSLRALFAPVAVLALTVPLLAQGSDSCSTAQSISGPGPFAFDLTTATTGSDGQGNGACNFNGSTAIQNDVWFRWSAPSLGTYVFTTGTQTTVDTKVAVYAGTTCPPGAPISCDDDSGGAQAVARIFATAGQTLLFQLGTSPFGAPGTGTFRIEIDGPPANDDCATPAQAFPGGSTYDNTAATTGSQGQSTNCGPIHNDLWFTWTATTSGTATIETCFQTAVNTIIAVYPGSGCPTAPELGCNDDACGGVTSSVTVPIAVGAPYTIQIGSQPGSPGGPASFTITETPGGGPTTTYCYGDGSGTQCPCGNNGLPRRGCGNSVNASGAKLDASGDARVSADTLVLRGAGMPPHSTAVYFQATLRVNNGAGVVLGDGLRCVAGTFIRLGYKVNNGAGGSGYGGPLGDTPISVRGGIPSVGATRDYQVYFRDPAAFCQGVQIATYNLSNGLEAIWTP